VNTSYMESNPCISADGLTLFFDSDRPGGSGNRDIWVTTRATTEGSWSQPVNLGPAINSPAYDGHANLSEDGLSLYFSSERPGGYGNRDTWLVTRETTSASWSEPRNLGPGVNSAAYDSGPNISGDGKTLFFGSGRLGGYGGGNGWDLWMTRRTSTDDPWTTPVHLGPIINSPYQDIAPCISADGSILYFYSNRPGGNGIWQAPLIPLVDFNGNGIVDTKDRAALMEHWGQINSPCDIGPSPLGDGRVDAADLEVLMRYWGQEVDDPTLLAHWPLDETHGLVAHNRAGGDDGTVTGQPQWRPQDGMVGGALESNGTTFMAADVPFSPADGPFSVLVWIRGGAAGQTIVSQAGGVSWLMAGSGEGALMTELSSGQAGGELLSQTIIIDGNWHRLAFTWDGANRRLYVDSVLVAQDSQNSLADTFGKLLIGAAKDMAPGACWTGLIDDVRIYNRVVTP
jgi:hypothetical protein